MGARLTLLAIGGLACLALACLAQPAAATFPGRNGLMVFDTQNGDGRFDVTLSVDLFNTRSRQGRTVYSCRNDLGDPEVDCLLSAARTDPSGDRVAGSRIEGRSIPGDQPRSFIFTLGIDGSGYREVPGSNGFFGAVAWSPDGRTLVAERNGGLWTIPAVGGTPRQVVARGTRPDWSSNRTIAYVDNDLYVVGPGGIPQRVASLNGGTGRPSWSPGSARLAFASGDIWTVRHDGRGLKRVTRRGGESPVWSPDGRRIAFVRNRTLYTVRPTGRGLRRVRRLRDNDIDFSEAFSDWQALPRRR